MAYTTVLEAVAARRAGSSPVPGNLAICQEMRVSLPAVRPGRLFLFLVLVAGILSSPGCSRKWPFAQTSPRSVTATPEIRKQSTFDDRQLDASLRQVGVMVESRVGNIESRLVKIDVITPMDPSDHGTELWTIRAGPGPDAHYLVIPSRNGLAITYAEDEGAVRDRLSPSEFHRWSKLTEKAK